MATFLEDDSLEPRFRTGLTGSLEKRGHVVKNWKERYFTFVPDERTLKYFTDSSLTKLKGEYDIKDTSSVEIVSEGLDGHPFTLALKTGEEINYMAAKDQATLMNWYGAIQESIHNGFPEVNQPDIWSKPFFPKYNLFVKFGNGDVKQNGNAKKSLVSAEATLSPPTLSFSLPATGDYYSIIAVSPDMVNPLDSRRSETITQWFCANVPGDQSSAGIEILPYFGCAPVYGRKMRLYFLICKQNGAFSEEKLSDLNNMYSTGRIGPTLTQIAKACGINEAPIAVARYFVDWDESCNGTHHKLNYLAPFLYRSPAIKIDLQKELVKNESLDDVFANSASFQPTVNLMISYEKASGSNPKLHGIDNGAILEPHQVGQAPSVSFTPENQDDLYLLIMTDPDSPSRDDPKYREFVHWAVANIPKGDLTHGDVLLSYLGSAPPYNSGYHRYIFCLYRQNGRLSSSQIRESQSNLSTRSGITTSSWVRSLGLGDSPVAVHCFLAKWDESVDDVHEGMGWTPPAQYMSPRQKVLHQGHIAATGSPSTVKVASPASAVATTISGKVSAPIGSGGNSSTGHHFARSAPDSNANGSNKNRRMSSHKKFLNKELDALVTTDEVVKSLMEGEMIEKKLKTDFGFKKRFVWIDPYKRTLNWAKDPKDKHDPDSYKYMDIRNTGLEFNKITKEVRVYTAAGYLDLKIHGHNGVRAAQRIDSLVKFVELIMLGNNKKPAGK